MISYTAKYTKLDSGYKGQLVEWPEVVIEGKDLEECRAMLRDALNEMVLAYIQAGTERRLSRCVGFLGFDPCGISGRFAREM